MISKNIHLICNAHLDPVYMWQLNEGLTEALSTFRTACKFCKKYNTLIFNHNESFLYDFIRINEPELFSEIQKLVKDGKWNIMGGWYLQPDCNMPSGESLIRQIFTGKAFFKKYFDKEPSVAINFDSFGHTRGLVQILKKSGYKSYIFCRPKPCINENDFIWKGFDGSEIHLHHSSEHYCTNIGKAAEMISDWLKNKPKDKNLMYLWGIGDHGGGPSESDIHEVNAIIENNTDFNIIHSTTEAFSNEVNTDDNYKKLPEFDGVLNPVAPGSYTTLMRVKQAHRTLENAIYSAEKMMSSASANGLMVYEKDKLNEAVKDLLLTEFHDILPGSIIKDAENDILCTAMHGLEIAVNLKLQAFIALLSGQKPMNKCEIPVFVYNFHPYPVKSIFECEYSLPQDQNLTKDELNEYLSKYFSSGSIVYPQVYKNGEKIPCQLEKHRSNKAFEARKHTVFYAEIPPFTMERFDCKFIKKEKKDFWNFKKVTNDITLKENPDISVTISKETGLISSYKVKGHEFINGNALRPIVINDKGDAYGWGIRAFTDICGEFKPMNHSQICDFLGFDDCDDSNLKILEDGEVRTVIQSLFRYKSSDLCIKYIIPKHGFSFEAEVYVYWNEKGKMLKMSIPTTLDNASYKGQQAFGTETYLTDNDEVPSHKWSGLFNENFAFTASTDGGYGSSSDGKEIRITLLRSPLYLSSEFNPKSNYDHNLFAPRTDTGEHIFKLRFTGGQTDIIRRNIDFDSLLFNEKPYVLSVNPKGNGKLPKCLFTCDNQSIVVYSLKQAENCENKYIVHLCESSGEKITTVVSSPLLCKHTTLSFTPYELKTLIIDNENKTITESPEILI